MRTEAVKAVAAKIDLGLHPLLHLIQLGVIEPIDARLRFRTIRDEAALAQHLQMPRHRWPRDVEFARDLAGVALVFRQHSDDFAPGRVCQCLECIHDFN